MTNSPRVISFVSLLIYLVSAQYQTLLFKLCRKVKNLMTDSLEYTKTYQNYFALESVDKESMTPKERDELLMLRKSIQ